MAGDPRSDAIIRAVYIDAPEDAQVEVLCEKFGYGAVMDAAARLWAKKDSMGALYVAGGCLECRDLQSEARQLRKDALNQIADEGQEFDADFAAMEGE